MVAVKAHEADKALSTLSPAIRLVLFHGPDHGLAGERAVALAAASVSDASDPFQLVRIDGDAIASDPMRLTDEANTIGLFGGKRAIRVAVGSRFPLAAIEPLLAVPPQDSIVILEAGELAANNPIRTAIERSRHGLAVPCYGDEGRTLEGIVDQTLREERMTIDRDAKTFLLSRLGADRRLSRRELEKLITYVRPALRIELADIEAIVGDAAAREVDDILDATFTGDLTKLDRAFARFTLSGEDLGTLLGFVTRHAQSLMNARAVVDAGDKSAQEIVKSMRLPFPRWAAAEAALKRWSQLDILQAIAGLHAVGVQVRLNPALAGPLAMRALWNLAMQPGRAGAPGSASPSA
jgi:DNA polymerase-3 subunit delta